MSSAIHAPTCTGTANVTPTGVRATASVGTVTATHDDHEPPPVLIMSMSATFENLFISDGAGHSGIIPMIALFDASTGAPYKTANDPQHLPIHATSAATLVKSGYGVLNSVIVNTKGTGTSTVSIYDGLDSATGTLLAVIDSANLSGTFFYDVAFSIGCYVVAVGTATPDLTICTK